MIEPYYDEGDIQIYLGDCLEIMPCLPKVDLVLTDPPYGIGNKMSGGTWGSAIKYADFRAWDEKPNDSTVKIMIDLSKKSIIWGGNYFSLPPSRCWLVWDKRNAVPTMADCELAWTNFDKPVKRFSCGVGIHTFGHPTEKPLKLIKWCIKQANNISQTILDPFMGSGTTLVAAKELGRKAIGIEIEEKYCEIAVRRLQQEVFKWPK